MEKQLRTKKDIRNEKWITSIYYANIACNSEKIKEVINDIAITLWKEQK